MQAVLSDCQYWMRIQFLDVNTSTVLSDWKSWMGIQFLGENRISRWEYKRRSVYLEAFTENKTGWKLGGKVIFG